MGIIARFGVRKAIYRKGRWMAADRSLEAQLNSATDEWIQSTGGPPIWDHDPERTTATRICESLSGRVTRHIRDPTPALREEFLRRRQIGLPF